MCVAIDRADKHDIGTPSTSPMNDGAAVDMPEGEVSTPTDHSTTFAGRSSTERSVVAKAIIGVDLTECTLRDALTQASRDCRLCAVPT